MMNLKMFFIAFCLVVLAGTIQDQNREMALNVTPGVEIPFGPLSPDGNKMYTFGGSAALI